VHHGSQPRQEQKPVFSQFRVGRVHRHRVEEAIDRLPQSRHDTHCVFKSLASDFRQDEFVGTAEDGEKAAFLGEFEKAWIGFSMIGLRVTLFFDPDDVDGPSIGGEQIGTVRRFQEPAQGVHASHEADEVVFAAQREYRIDRREARL